MEGTAKTRPEILKVVLGPYVQYCPCEALEQKPGKKPESELKVIEISPAFFDFGLNFFRGLNQKSAMISMCKIHIYIDSERFR